MGNCVTVGVAGVGTAEGSGWVEEPPSLTGERRPPRDQSPSEMDQYIYLFK